MVECPFTLFIWRLIIETGVRVDLTKLWNELLPRTFLLEEMKLQASSRVSIRLKNSRKRMSDVHPFPIPAEGFL